MSVKPILFNTETVRAILDGRKTVTRRVLRGEAQQVASDYVRRYSEDLNTSELIVHWWVDTPLEHYALYRPGDVLWVRETWRLIDFDFIDTDWNASVQYKADMAIGERWHDLSPDERTGWRPSIHMPREAARIFLRVTDVRVERLQTSFFEPICPIFAVQAEGIDIGDTCRECIENYGEPCCVDTVDEDGSDLYGGECGELDQSRGEFSDLWDSTIKPADRERYGWAANPWVWVIEFERCEKPEEG